ncbi:macro domain-containing protein [uncultured Bacteroides sp.]|uniref:macro domain-containing protein n=1 Tax=uncultured Bacteroides sp. TaxID=162156 RepID=UPI002AA5EEC1|nr:macro domain-containing protein [uncultured Bacteroides sp.]
MIKFVQGNFFDYEADIRINTVNCVGIMGAGVALQFKNRYPEMNMEYVRLCSQRVIRPGKPHVWISKNLFSNSEEDIIIINFPTKDHWKNPSEYSYIEDGLKWLREYLEDKPNSTITVPALGCGHGGLDWEKVKKMIFDYLSDLETSILVFEPESSNTKNLNLSEKEKELLNIKNINHIIPSDSNYPIQLKGKSATDFYIKGDVSIFNKKTVSIIINNKAEDREFNALIESINQFKNEDIVLIIGLNSNVDSNLLKEIIAKKLRVIVVLSTGILQLKLRKDIKEIWDNDLITTISLFHPNQTWRKYNNIQNSKFLISISKAILINTIEINFLKSIEKELFNRSKIYYINYWKETNTFFERIQAKPIGRISGTGVPNIRDLEEVLCG